MDVIWQGEFIVDDIVFGSRKLVATKKVEKASQCLGTDVESRTFSYVVEHNSFIAERSASPGGGSQRDWKVK
ncbi:hypothetical protein [Rhodopirellula halodulae]|uniref:hypothetical protein n=1 Tax=Rhodopirellula halodulae TaxID=2894198 RepID=UPI001E58F3E9|nr:hypothetical protein [Rhodopirellula sp. JC737]